MAEYLRVSDYQAKASHIIAEMGKRWQDFHIITYYVIYRHPIVASSMQMDHDEIKKAL